MRVGGRRLSSPKPAAMNGFESDSDGDEDYGFVMIEAKREREPDEDDQDEERNPQRQRPLPTIREDVEELDSLMEELVAAREDINNNPTPGPNAEADLAAIAFARRLLDGVFADFDKVFDGVSLSLLPKLIRVRELFRKFMPVDIANYGRISMRYARRDQFRRTSTFYRNMVTNVMDYYTKGIATDELEQPSPVVGRKDTATRIIADAGEKALTTYNDIASATPADKPYVSAERMFYDEYIRGVISIRTSVQSEALFNPVLKVEIERGSTLQKAFSTFWRFEHDRTDPFGAVYVHRNMPDSSGMTRWYNLMIRFDFMFEDGLVLSAKEMEELDAIFDKGLIVNNIRAALRVVYDEVRAERGDILFNVQAAISALPDLAVSKYKLEEVYTRAQPMSDLDFERIRALTLDAEWLDFVSAHNAFVDHIDGLSALPYESGADTSEVMFNYKKIGRLVKDLPEGDVKDEYVKRYKSLVESMQSVVSNGRFEIDFTTIKKPRMLKRTRSTKWWNQEIEDAMYEFKNGLYNNFQRHNNLISHLTVLAERMNAEVGKKPLSNVFRQLHRYTLNMTRALLFGSVDRIQDMHINDYVMTDLIGDVYLADTVRQYLIETESQYGDLLDRWDDALEGVAQAFMDVASEAGPSSGGVGAMVGQLASLANSSVLRKDAAKLAKCVGHTGSARPSYLLDRAFVDGPAHDNAEYAATRSQLMTHLGAQFDDHTRGMVQLALELKKLSIASDHADTLAQLAVAHFSQRL